MNIIRWFRYFSVYFLKIFKLPTKLPNVINISSFSEIWQSPEWLEASRGKNGWCFTLFYLLECLYIFNVKKLTTNQLLRGPCCLKLSLHSDLYPSQVLNIGNVSNETDTDVHMYTCWIYSSRDLDTLLLKLEVRYCMENTLAFIQLQQYLELSENCS